jgi:hypothetical protein
LPPRVVAARSIRFPPRAASRPPLELFARPGDPLPGRRFFFSLGQEPRAFARRDASSSPDAAFPNVATCSARHELCIDRNTAGGDEDSLGFAQRPQAPRVAIDVQRGGSPHVPRYAMRRFLASAAPAVALACTVGPGGSFPDSSGSAASVTAGTVTAAATTASDAGTDAGESSSTATEGEAESTAATSDDAATDDAGTTTGGPSDPSATDDASGDASSSDTGPAGTPLDPDLDIPEGDEQCDYPGDLNACAGIAVCRFATVEYGLCESCDVCGNLNAACTQGTDCDILFSCYAGRCTNFCTLGSFECGPAEDCLDVGHPTRGVCNPFA